MADGGIGEAALLSEAGGASAVSGMDLAADAGMGAGNAIGGGALSSYGAGAGAADLASSSLSQGISSIPSGPGVPKSIALNDTQQAINAANQASQFSPGTAGLPGSQFMGPPSTISAGTIAGELGQAGTAANPLSGIGSSLMSTWNSMSPGQKVAVGGVAGLAAMMQSGAFKANFMDPYKPQTAQQVGLGRTLSPQYRPTFAAEGGVMKLAIGGMPGQQYPMSNINYNGYNAPTQMPTSALNVAGYTPDNTPLSGALSQNMASGGAASGITAAGESNGPLQMYQAPNTSGGNLQELAQQYGISLPSGMATGGITELSSGGAPGYNLGGYSDGGRLLKGPGDGMSDDIPASIADKQPARLADGEFVVPADVVSHLGNGSTDAGAKHLYNMMDKVRKARTGHTRQGKQIKSEKYLPT